MNDNLDDAIQFRVGKAHKLRFIKAARKNGKKPADLIREFIRNYGEGA